ncbi:MAG: hypothetical protein WBS20_16115 [Lysobacterales bacterium]
MSKITTVTLLLITLLAMAMPADAYIGPGAGISVLGSLLSILATIFVAIGAILLWPLRTFMKRRKARREEAAGVEADRTNGDG